MCDILIIFYQIPVEFITKVSFKCIKMFTWDPTSFGVGNEAFFIKMWKHLPSRRILKTLRGSPKGKVRRGQYLLAVGLGSYKWYQSQTLNDVPVRRLSPKGCEHEAMCQQGRWPPKGWIEGVPHQLKKGTSASKDAKSWRGGLWDPTSAGEENETPFIRVWRPLPSRLVSKTLRGSPKIFSSYILLVFNEYYISNRVLVVLHVWCVFVSFPYCCDECTPTLMQYLLKCSVDEQIINFQICLDECFMYYWNGTTCFLLEICKCCFDCFQFLNVLNTKKAKLREYRDQFPKQTTTSSKLKQDDEYSDKTESFDDDSDAEKNWRRTTLRLNTRNLTWNKLDLLSMLVR